ncbi:hypothetical protein RchiOBHm_Chr2g0110111 [Rosa chinensis]|uniref:Uncharacterized protein n=1 Tax=Rosa chinensis TaxID=74649 RepID=A0A2P6RPQ7_ROSCH|nr:hypothetical protein RchiOBHm_Chr2g0110111 [Rosa chinensis]
MKQKLSRLQWSLVNPRLVDAMKLSFKLLLYQENLVSYATGLYKTSKKNFQRGKCVSSD